MPDDEHQVPLRFDLLDGESPSVRGGGQHVAHGEVLAPQLSCHGNLAAAVPVPNALKRRAISARFVRRGWRREEASVMDLATVYMGLRLRNPLVASASPLSQTVEGVRRLADAGIGAVVVHSLFEEELQDGAAAPSGPPPNAEHLSPREYLGLLERASAAVDVPVIFNSLDDSWRLLEDGASRNVCKDVCAPLIKDSGGELGGPTFRGMSDKTPYRMFWWAW